MIDLAPPPPPPPAPPPPGWDGILQPGERILWQGQPAPGVDWTALLSARTLFGLAFGGFALFWMAMAFSITRQGPADIMGGLLGYVFPLFGIPFLLVGLNLAGGHLIRDALVRRKTYYTLTDRSAFVATSLFGRRRLDRHDLTATLRPRLDDGDPGSVLFAGVPLTDTLACGLTIRLTGRQIQSPSGTPQLAGFHRIPEARQVYRLLTEALANRMKAP